MHNLLFFVGIWVVLLLVSSCGTTSLHGCDNKLGVEKSMCIEQMKMVQYQIWKQTTMDGYRERI